MGREYEDHGSYIRRRTRGSGGAGNALMVLGCFIAVSPVAGWLAALAGTLGPPGELNPVFIWGGVALIVLGLAGGAIGWAALGTKNGVAVFRVATVIGLLACFLFVPSCLAIQRLDELATERVRPDR